MKSYAFMPLQMPKICSRRSAIEMAANEGKSHRTHDKRPRSAVTSARTFACPAALRASSAAACFGVQPDPTLSLVAPSNRATVRYFHHFQAAAPKSRARIMASRVGLTRFAPRSSPGWDVQLPKTTATRKISVKLLRKPPHEKVDDFRYVDDGDFMTLRRKLARWAAVARQPPANELGAVVRDRRPCRWRLA